MRSAKQASLALLGLLVLVAGLWLWFTMRESGKHQPVGLEPGESQEAADEGATLKHAQAPAASAGGKPAEGQPRPDPARSEVQESQQARITGRCLDLQGQPIEGCKIQLVDYIPRKRGKGAPAKGSQKLIQQVHPEVSDPARHHR